MITDLSVFPANATEGQVGEYWYHEDTQAFFDDVDHYRMIKAMCRLSCSVCDKSAEEQGSEGTKRRHRFRSIEQLKGHLFHQHRLFMCSLCLEGRKVRFCLLAVIQCIVFCFHLFEFACLRVMIICHIDDSLAYDNMAAQSPILRKYGGPRDWSFFFSNDCSCCPSSNVTLAFL